MVRIVNSRRRMTTKMRHDQQWDRVQSGYKNWVDPFPYIHGTKPEKMVYQALVERGIRFYFLNEFTYTIPEIDFAKEYQSDFILPDHKIIIEVQGSYWHSKPEAIEADAFKFAVYQQTGWRPLAWWDFDIESRLHELFAEDPVLRGFSVLPKNTASTELAPVSRKKQDTSQGIRTMNYRRGQRQAYKKKPVSVSSLNKKRKRG